MLSIILTAIKRNHAHDTTTPVYFLLSLGEIGKIIIAGISNSKLAMMRQGQRDNQNMIVLIIFTMFASMRTPEVTSYN